MTAEEEFGASLRRTRRQIGISQTELADLMRDQGLNWFQTTVHKTEAAARAIRLNEVVALAAALKVDVVDLLGETAEPRIDMAAENAALRRRLKAVRAALDDGRDRA